MSKLMNIDQMALELCWQIERCGASEDLTKASIMASELRGKLATLTADYERLKKSAADMAEQLETRDTYVAL